MRSSCGWETISHGQGCAGGFSRALCWTVPLPVRNTVSLGGRAQVFWQIFLDVSSDDALRPLPSSRTALPSKLRQFMVHICPSHRLAVCLLLWDDQSGHLNADNPPARKAAGPSHYLSQSPSFPLTLPQVIRGAPQFPAAQNKCLLGNTQMLMKHHMEAHTCTWLCRAAGVTITPVLTLQQTHCHRRVPVTLLFAPHRP